jgi:hypothetical protein
MTNSATIPSPASLNTPTPPHFPLRLSIVAILLTSLSFPAAALGIRWGTGVPPPFTTDAFSFAWIYANSLQVLVWLILWPAAAFYPARNLSPRQTLYDLVALCICAFPPLTLSATLSDISLVRALPMLALQLSLALFAAGLILFTTPRSHLMQSLAAGLTASLALAGPLAVYLSAEFFPAAPDSWYPTIPLLAVSHAARTTVSAPIFWCIAATYALVGIVLILLPRPRPHSPTPHP